jgi:hypothetical protein
VKVQKLTDSSIARRGIGIKKLANNINELVQSIKSDPASKHTALALPEAVDTSRLFDLDANYRMWMTETTHLGNQFTEPYMVDDSTRQGISAWLARDRAVEEIHRLIEELRIMIRWVTSQQQKITIAASLCDGAY